MRVLPILRCFLVGALVPGPWDLGRFWLRWAPNACVEGGVGGSAVFSGGVDCVFGFLMCKQKSSVVDLYRIKSTMFLLSVKFRSRVKVRK